MRRLAAVFTGLIAAATALPADAGLIVSFNAAPSYTAGTTGNFFDVLVTGTGTAEQVDSSQVNLTATGGSGFTFTGAVAPTSSTPPYLFSPPALSVLSGAGTTSLSFIDFSLAARAATLVGVGQTFNIGRVFFDLAAGATGPITVTAATEFSDPLGNPITPAVAQTTINVAPAAVPEPSSLLLLTAVGAAGVAVRRWRKTPVAG